jgi:hypothetical protein
VTELEKDGAIRGEALGQKVLHRLQDRDDRGLVVHRAPGVEPVALDRGLEGRLVP